MSEVSIFTPYPVEYFNRKILNFYQKCKSMTPLPTKKKQQTLDVSKAINQTILPSAMDK